jgi:hypothetical protein
MSKCQHMNFRVNANIGRLMGSDKGNPEKVNCFLAEIRVHCVECGLPFEWVGFECGLSSESEHVDTSAQELRAPIKPKGVLAMPGIPGYTVKVN